MERIRPREAVGEIHEDGVALHRWRVRHVKRDAHHERGIANEQPGVTVIRMVIVWAMRKDQICLPFANEPRDDFSILQGRHDLAIVNVQHLRFHAHTLGGFLGLRRATLGQRTTSHFPVTDVAVGHGDQLYLVAKLCPLNGAAAQLKLGVIRMRTKGNDAQHTFGLSLL